MNLYLQQMFAEATRLTRAGNLQEATVAIQAALRAGTPASSASPAFQPAFPPGFDAASVIDIEARRIDTEPVDRSAPRPAAARLVQGQFIAGRHSEAGLQRDYKLYVPPGHHEGRLPLVVMLHGCTQDPDDFAAGTRMNEAALERGFYVLYPAQAKKANSSRCWNWFKHNHQRRGRGEPALLAGMTRDVIARHPVDASRVYVAGLSAGGAMAAILGEAYPELYAAVGVHSGLPTGAAADLPSAFAAMQGSHPHASSAAPRPPTIVFHGDQDITVHPVNGDRVVSAKAGEATVGHERARSRNGRDYTRRVYRDAADRVVAEHWSVHGAGHAWSGGHASGTYTDAQGPDASAAMLDFFMAQRLTTPG